MSKKMFVALPLGGLLDRAAMGTEKDVEVSPHKPIAVPAAYGRSLVENRFAIEVDAEAGKKAAATSRQQSSTHALDAAEVEVTRARAAVEAAGADLVAKTDAEAELKTAEDALAALKG